MNHSKKLRVTRLPSDDRVLNFISIIFIAIGIWMLLWSSIFSSQSDFNYIGFSVGIIMIAITFIFLIPPILIVSLLTPTRLILRYGLLFRLSISLDEISEADFDRTYARFPVLFKIGVRYSPFNNRLSVLRSKNGIIRLKLRQKIWIGWIFKSAVDEIYFDVLDARDLLSIIGKSGLEAD